MKHVHTLAVAVLLLAAGGASYFSGVPVSEKAVADPPDSSIPKIPRNIPQISAPVALKRHADWLATPGGRRWMKFMGSYTESRRNIVGYTDGQLTQTDRMLTGEGEQFWSNRTYAKSSVAGDNPPPFSVPGDYSHPFNPAATDRLGFTIDPATGKAKFILLSHGGGSTEIQLQYRDGVFYGFQPGGGMHAFVLKRVLDGKTLN